MPFSTLEIGKRALLAQRFGIETTSNNIANANTEGYSRRAATFKQTNDQYRQGNFYGTGVIADKLRSFREDFFDREIRDSLSRKSSFETGQKLLKRVEGILAEPSDNGLGNVISDFFISWDQLASNPTNPGYKQKVVSESQRMAERFNHIANSVRELRDSTKDELVNDVDEINSLIEKISGLNNKISGNHSTASDGSLSMIDEREKLIEELSEYGKVSVKHNENGIANVHMNGINLVTSSSYNQFKLQENTDPISGERTLGIYQTDKQGNILNQINTGSGSLNTKLKYYNEVLDSADSSGNFSLATSLNELAAEIGQRVNTVSVTGYGQNDTGVTPPGRNIFEPGTGTINAFNISVNSNIINDANNIPVSSAANQSSNNDIAIQIAQLADDINFLNNRTPGEYYTDLLGKTGNMLNDAEKGLQNSELVTGQLVNQRESIIGVNLDEEAINLIKFQRSFEAASRVVSITDEILGTVVNLGR